MTMLRSTLSFLRWRLVPVRYLTRLGQISPSTLSIRTLVRTSAAATIQSHGFMDGPRMPYDLVNSARDRYLPRAQSVVPKATGHPFVNLFERSDIEVSNPILRMAFSPLVFDTAVDYFGGNVRLDSVQVLFSYPTSGELRESQYWHLDYGDSRSFHCVIYLNDVLDLDHGPFVFVDKHDSARIGRSLIVRRIDDEIFRRELGPGTIRKVFGPAGTSVYVDPAACYHFGSRCRGCSRLAIFVTFNSCLPFVSPSDFIRQNRDRLHGVAAALRPDLNAEFLRRVI